MDALEFLRRCGLLMPPPHKNLVHYYAALAAAARSDRQS